MITHVILFDFCAFGYPDPAGRNETDPYKSGSAKLNSSHENLLRNEMRGKYRHLIILIENFCFKNCISNIFFSPNLTKKSFTIILHN